MVKGYSLVISLWADRNCFHNVHQVSVPQVNTQIAPRDVDGCTGLATRLQNICTLVIMNFVLKKKCVAKGKLRRLLFCDECKLNILAAIHIFLSDRPHINSHFKNMSNSRTLNFISKSPTLFISIFCSPLYLLYAVLPSSFHARHFLMLACFGHYPFNHSVSFILYSSCLPI
jgi:hypothetical protein